MTFSLLVRDPASDAIGGAAATGSLCVGGWVLRGMTGIGLSASQGKSPSTLWGENVLAALKHGQPAADALQSVVSADTGSAQRQLTTLDQAGNGAAFSGDQNTPEIAHQVFEGGVAAGNMLAGTHVIDAMVQGFLTSTAPFAERLLASLRAADAAGSDVRGLQSAALLILAPNRAPLTLRVDYSDTPLDTLEALYEHATTGDYAAWTLQVPTLANPDRTCD